MVSRYPGHANEVKTGTIVSNRYRVQGLIGRGAMAEVHVATDLRLDRTVALKIALAEESALGIDERTKQEIRALASLDHPHVVRLLDAGRWNDRDFLVLEHVDGPSLALRLRAGPLTADEAGQIIAEAASALAYLHERGIVHRDVKPANILLDRFGHAHVADFGAARLLDAPAGLTATGELIGTASYLSPEQVRGDAVGPATDVYALGLVSLECLTGRREYDGTPAEAAVARLTRPPAIEPGIPWVERLEAMTALDPSARVPAATVAEWFGPSNPTPTLVLGTLPAAARRARPRPSRRALARAGVGVGAAAAAVTAAGVLSAASGGNPGHHPGGAAVTSQLPTHPATSTATPSVTPAAATSTPSVTKPAPEPTQPPPKKNAKHDDHHGRGHDGG